MNKTTNIPECPKRHAYSICIESAADAIVNKDALRDSTLLITGASGMIGGALCRTLLYLNRTENLNVKLILPVRASTDRAAFKGILDRDEVTVTPIDLTDPIDVDGLIDYIIHAACPTGSNELKNTSADVTRFAMLSTIRLLDFAVRKGVKGFVYLSSMEAYGAFDGVADEANLGYIDLTLPRSCYPESKRCCENLTACYASQYGVKAVSARLAQVLGAGIKAGEKRAYAYFAASALKGEPVVLKTDGMSFGNYIHLADAVSAILLLLTEGKAGQIYNVSADNASLTIKEFTLRICELLSKGKSGIVFDIPGDSASLPYAARTGLILDNKKIKRLGWHNRFTLDEMILSVGQDLKEINKL